MSVEIVREPYVGRHRRDPDQRVARPCHCGACLNPAYASCLPPTDGPRHARPRPTQPTRLPVPYRILGDPTGPEPEHDDQDHALAEVRPFRRPPRRRVR
ncbi:hypothetical protein [Streptomyces sp. NPDC094049]|uniref:hypothetical protein n=1 Tax=Streptomyces sp. NPDC094049 TaxID=3154987 RepID=UPI0033317848